MEHPTRSRPSSLNLVTAETFLTQEGVLVAQMMLIASGIPCLLADYHTIFAAPYLDIALNGIKVMVRPTDLADAQAVLAPLLKSRVLAPAAERRSANAAWQVAALYWWLPLFVCAYSLVPLCRLSQKQEPPLFLRGKMIAIVVVNIFVLTVIGIVIGKRSG